jgi:hypothetical protein
VHTHSAYRNKCTYVCVHTSINIQHAYSVRLFGGKIISQNRYGAERAKVSPAHAHIFRSNANTISRVALRFEIKIVGPSKYMFVLYVQKCRVLYYLQRHNCTRYSRGRRLTRTVYTCNTPYRYYVVNEARFNPFGGTRNEGIYMVVAYVMRLYRGWVLDESNRNDRN